MTTTNNETPLGVESPAPAKTLDSLTSCVALPPVHPRYTKWMQQHLQSYGLACAKAVADDRDSKLQAASARIASLEARIAELEDLVRMHHGAYSEEDRLRQNAEFERDNLAQRVGELDKEVERERNRRRQIDDEAYGYAEKIDDLNVKNADLRCQLEVKGADADRYQEIRRGANVSVVNGIGDTLAGQALDDYISSCIAARSAQATARADQQQAGGE